MSDHKYCHEEIARLWMQLKYLDTQNDKANKTILELQKENEDKQKVIFELQYQKHELQIKLNFELNRYEPIK